jgi:hypothetical protein
VVGIAPGVGVDVDDVAVLAKRSTRATTHAAPGNTVPHCLKARFVLMTVERSSCRRLMMAKRMSAARPSHGR